MGCMSCTWARCRLPSEPLALLSIMTSLPLPSSSEVMTRSAVVCDSLLRVADSPLGIVLISSSLPRSVGAGGAGTAASRSGCESDGASTAASRPCVGAGGAGTAASRPECESEGAVTAASRPGRTSERGESSGVDSSRMGESTVATAAAAAGVPPSGSSSPPSRCRATTCSASGVIPASFGTLTRCTAVVAARTKPVAIAPAARSAMVPITCADTPPACG